METVVLQLVTIGILMESGEGVVGKSPGYIVGEAARVMDLWTLDEMRGALGDDNVHKLENWLATWEKWEPEPEDETEGLGPEDPGPVPEDECPDELVLSVEDKQEPTEGPSFMVEAVNRADSKLTELAEPAGAPSPEPWTTSQKKRKGKQSNADKI